MSLFLGIDGGGTQTRAVIVDGTGQVLGSGSAGPSNYHSVGMKATGDAILAAMSQAVQRAGLEQGAPFTATCLGLAGCGSEEDLANLAPLAAALPGVPAGMVRIESDLRIAHAGAFEGEPGIILIAGTGSACLGIDHLGHAARAGGWGPMFDDPGSGFDIGRMAIMHTLRAADGREEGGALASMVVQTLGGNLRAIARMSATGEDRTRIAALAPLVFQAASDRDSNASAIIRMAVDELARMVVAVAAKLEFSSGNQIVVLGGLNLAGRVFFQELYDAIRRRLPLSAIVSDMLPPVLGAILLAMKRTDFIVTDDMLTQMKRTMA